MIFQACVKHIIELLFGFSINKSISEHSVTFVDQNFNQCLSLWDFISKHREYHCGDISWSEWVVTVFVNWEFGFDLGVQVNEERGKSFWGVRHLPVSKPGVRKDCLHEFSIHGKQLFRIRVVHVADLDVSSESSWQFMSAECCWGVHWSHNGNSLQTYKVQVFVVKAFVADKLMQKWN